MLQPSFWYLMDLERKREKEDSSFHLSRDIEDRERCTKGAVNGGKDILRLFTGN